MLKPGVKPMLIEWIPMTGSVTRVRYLQIKGSKASAVVRTTACPNGKYLWTCGTIMDYADSIDDAKEMVEGLWVAR